MNPSLPSPEVRSMRPFLAPVTTAIAITSVLLLVPAASSPAADRPKEPLVEKVAEAIKRGKKYLIANQGRGGDWEGHGASGFPGGCTALALLALLNAGVPPDDPVIKNGIKYLKSVPQSDTYVIGLRTMVFCLLGDKELMQDIDKDVNWLI